jgi:hypothetical protein
MKTVIDGFHAAGRDTIKFAVGGAPISQMFADEIGADGYGQNASAAVDLFLRLAKGESAPAPSQSAVQAKPAASAASRRGEKSTFKVLYWQEIPSQVKVEDDAGNEISVELGQKITEHIDATAQKRGFTNSDAYLAQWKWSDEQERPGSAHEVAEALKSELLAQVGR